MDLKHQLKINLQEIMKHYASYVRCVRMSLVKIGVSARDLTDFLLTLSAFEHKEGDPKLTLFYGMRKKLKDVDKIEDIFRILTEEYASFLNYEVFESIIDEFEVDNTQKKLKYPEHLVAYIYKHKINEFCEINPLLKNLKDSSKELILKFDVKLTDTLGSLKERTEAVAKLLELRPSALRLLSIEEGCVLVTTLIPAHIADFLFIRQKIFPVEKEKEFRTLSLLWLKSNGSTKLIVQVC